MKLFRKSVVFLFCLILLLAAGSLGVLGAEPSVAAYSAVVMDVDTGVYYYAKDPDTMRVPASMTKLMTAYVIFEELDAGRISYDSPVTISAHGAAVAATSGYSNVPLSQGETYTVDTMLRLMLIPSACGACSAMADYISGSEAAFADRMNAEAAAIGMTAQFTNSHGAINHYVTPRSMAILASNFIHKHPGILKYTSMQSVTFKGRTYTNTNHFLNSDYYAGVDGMKTGTSSAAGSCITVSAQKNGRRIVSVVMNSSSRYNDSRALLDYGFACIEQGNRDAANASLTMSSKRNTVRLGAYFPVTVDVALAGYPFVASGGWTVNGAVVESFNPMAFQGGAVSQSFFLDGYAGEKVTLGFFLNLPDGSVKTVTQSYDFSTEAPCAFLDIDGHWSETAVASLKDQTVFSGYNDGSFRPDASISRGEFVTALVRLLESQGKLTVADEASGFSDMQGHWSDRYVAAAKKLEIVFGCGDNRFSPDADITREEMACFLQRSFDLKTQSLTATAFADEGDISTWARDAVLADVENGLFVGYLDGTFRPQNHALRAETAILLYKAGLLP